MKQFEWLSTGLLAPLPDQEERLSPPDDGVPLVLVYLPWNHRLLGVRLLGRFDACANPVSQRRSVGIARRGVRGR